MRADQIRCTVAGDTRTLATIVRQIQCVLPTGFSCNVT